MVDLFIILLLLFFLFTSDLVFVCVSFFSPKCKTKLHEIIDSVLIWFYNWPETFTFSVQSLHY